MSSILAPLITSQEVFHLDYLLFKGKVSPTSNSALCFCFATLFDFNTLLCSNDKLEPQSVPILFSPLGSAKLHHSWYYMSKMKPSVVFR